VNFFTLDSHAIGSIQANGAQSERLEELTERIATGEFHHPVAEGMSIPARCVDGRSAGGSETLFVADDLTVKGLATPDGTTLSAYKNMLNWLRVHGFEVGGHTDTYVQGNASGCGANDKLEIIYDYIANRGDVLRAVGSDLGIAISEDVHDLIVKNAQERSQFSGGRELLNVLKENANSEFLDTLVGEHKEVATVVNMKEGTTLDRTALKNEFGPDYQAFNVDAWSFEAAAKAISVEPLEAFEIEAKVVAMVYYNLATALVLAGPKMRVIVLS
jgi:hypothetical protein